MILAVAACQNAKRDFEIGEMAGYEDNALYVTRPNAEIPAPSPIDKIEKL